jgi:hypothetical protein
VGNNWDGIADVVQKSMGSSASPALRGLYQEAETTTSAVVSGTERIRVAGARSDPLKKRLCDMEPTLVRR